MYEHVIQEYTTNNNYYSVCLHQYFNSSLVRTEKLMLVFIDLLCLRFVCLLLDFLHPSDARVRLERACAQ